MKITDVTLTLFAWDDIPATQYGQHSRFAGSSALGLLRIRTDDGVEGNAFRPSFTVVAFVFIGAGMLGWRAVVVAVRSTRERRDAGSRGSVRQR